MELFEKKQIEPTKYDIDILCDFAHDKTKRLLAKVETLQKELSLLHKEQLQQDSDALQRARLDSDFLNLQVIPRIKSLISYRDNRHSLGK